MAEVDSIVQIMVSREMRSVVVTGASTGIGRATALRLDSEGWRVFAGVRREEDAAALSRAASERLVPLRLDVTDSAQIGDGVERVAEAVGPRGLDGLVNNAGIAVFGPMEVVPAEEFRRQVDVNLFGQIAVTQAMLPLIRRSNGRIVFVSSLGGRMAYPFGGPYHASKYALEAAADSLRQELRPSRIEVSMIEPGAVDTAIWERGEQVTKSISARLSTEQERLYRAKLDRLWELGRKFEAHANSPEKVAKAIERALCSKRPRYRYTVGADARVQLFAHRLIPARTFDWLVAKSLRT